MVTQRKTLKRELERAVTNLDRFMDHIAYAGHVYNDVNVPKYEEACAQLLKIAQMLKEQTDVLIENI